MVTVLARVRKVVAVATLAILSVAAIARVEGDDLIGRALTTQRRRIHRAKDWLSRSRRQARCLHDEW
jgi:hypothetical protein